MDLVLLVRDRYTTRISSPQSALGLSLAFAALQLPETADKSPRRRSSTRHLFVSSFCNLRRPSKVRSAKLKSGLVQAAHLAHDRMQPARIGYGTGSLYLNANRDAIDDQPRLWSQEPNLDYPSDKTLAVIKVESLSGELIAVYMNYAMHANTLLLEGMISGDFPGEAER